MPAVQAPVAEPVYAKDIRFRGPMSYRGIRAVALLALFLSHMALLACFTSVLLNGLVTDDYIPLWFINLLRTLIRIEPVTFPLIMISAFSSVFRQQENFRKLLIFNGAAALLMYAFLAIFGEIMIRDFVIEIPKAVLQEAPIDKVINVLIPRVLTRVREDYGSATVPNLIRYVSGIFEQAKGIDFSSAADKLGEVGILGNVLNGFDLSSLSQYLSAVPFDKLQGIFDYLITQLPGLADLITPYIVNHYLNMNMFLDLFLCTLFYFFVSYRPKKPHPSRMFLFRCCAVLPALYIVISTMLNGQLRSGNLNLPAWAVALMVSRPPAALLIFFLMVLFMKYSETRFLEKGGTHEDYVEYLSSNRNSLSLSAFLCAVMVIICAADYGLSFVTELSPWRIGTTYTMIFGVPFLMLFSYSRKPKHMVLTGMVNFGFVLTYALFIFGILVLTLGMPDLVSAAIAG